nr:MAG TPA: hypothetical protein [Caudoviricetes sp.]DAK46198.1 MAG TPA: hypothetical protein [Caudoviricetes sp.]DAW48086.1 MAG TPA: hypothetical protein [Caudoviricetes sp.]
MTTKQECPSNQLDHTHQMLGCSFFIQKIMIYFN